MSMMKVHKLMNNQSGGPWAQKYVNVSFRMTTVALGALTSHIEVGTSLGPLSVLLSTITLSSILKEMYICNNSDIFPIQELASLDNKTFKL